MKGPKIVKIYIDTSSVHLKSQHLALTQTATTSIALKEISMHANKRLDLLLNLSNELFPRMAIAR